MYSGWGKTSVFVESNVEIELDSRTFSCSVFTRDDLLLQRCSFYIRGVAKRGMMQFHNLIKTHTDSPKCVHEDFLNENDSLYQ